MEHKKIDIPRLALAETPETSEDEEAYIESFRGFANEATYRFYRAIMNNYYTYTRILQAVKENPSSDYFKFWSLLEELIDDIDNNPEFAELLNVYSWNKTEHSTNFVYVRDVVDHIYKEELKELYTELAID